MKKIPLFDAHCDTAFELYFKNRSLVENDCHVDISGSRTFAPSALFFAIWGTPRHTGGLSYTEIYELLFKNLLTEIYKNSDEIAHCGSYAQAQAAFSEDKTAAFISIEGAELIGCDPEALKEQRERGVSMIGLSWNCDNALCGSCESGSGRGLTELGRRFVRVCNELGLIIDLSHCSERAFWDVIELAEAPVVASHSNSKTIRRHRRNLDDGQFRAIAGIGGTVGINLFTEFIGEGAVGLDELLRHIEHFLALGGENSLSIGSDFDGCSSLPEGISGQRDLTKLYDLLLRGFGKELADKIFFYNLMGVVKQVCGI